MAGKGPESCFAGGKLLIRTRTQCDSYELENLPLRQGVSPYTARYAMWKQGFPDLNVFRQ